MATYYSITDGNWNANATWSTSSSGSAGSAFPEAGDIAFIEGGHNVTLVRDEACGAVSISGATLTGGGNKITTNAATSNKPVNHDGTIAGILDIEVTNSGTGAVAANGWLIDASGTNNIRNLTINLTSGTASHNTIEFSPGFSLDGNLTITNGTLQGYNGTLALTIAGDVLVENGGTLGRSPGSSNEPKTASDTFRSLTVDSGGTAYLGSGVTKITGSRAADAYGLDLKDGTVEHNNGTVRYEGAGGTQLNFADTHIYNLELNVTSSGGSGITLYGDESNSVTINNNFTMENGSGVGILVPLSSTGYEFTVRNNMYMKYYDRTVNENMQFGYNQTCTGTWTVEGTLSLLNANEKVRIRATSGTFNLGGLINDGGRIDSQ